MKQSVGVVEWHTEVVKLSAIVSLECSIFAAWSIIEDISPNCLTILHRVVHSQRLMAGLWNVLGLLHLQQGRDEIEKTHKKLPTKQTEDGSTVDVTTCALQQRQQQADPRVRGQWQERGGRVQPSGEKLCVGQEVGVEKAMRQPPKPTSLPSTGSC